MLELEHHHRPYALDGECAFRFVDTKEPANIHFVHRPNWDARTINPTTASRRVPDPSGGFARKTFPIEVDNLQSAKNNVRAAGRHLLNVVRLNHLGGSLDILPMGGIPLGPTFVVFEALDLVTQPLAALFQLGQASYYGARHLLAGAR